MTTSLSAENLKPGAQARTFVSSTDGTEQPYNLFLPSAAKDGKRVPLVIALHGHGATWESWFKGTKVCEWAEKEGFAVLCPHGRGNFFYLGIGETDVWEAFDDVKKALPIDEDRVYLIGHSMGGWGTWNIAASKPDVFAAIVPMSSWAPLDLLGNLQYLNPLFIHGDNDPAVDVQRSRDANAVLAELGIPHKYIELPGVGHESAMISDMLPTIGDWLRDKRRTNSPTRVGLTTFTEHRNKAWWLSAVGMPGPGKLMAVNATLEGVTLKLEYKAESAPGTIYVDLGDAAFKSAAGKDVELVLPGGVQQEVPAVAVREKRFLCVATGTGSIAVGKAPPTAVTHVLAKRVSAESDMAEVLATMILNDTKVDGVLMSPSMLLPSAPTGDVGYDEMFDYVARLGGVTRDNEGSGVFKISGAVLNEKLADQKDWKPTWWESVKFYPPNEIANDKEYSVLVPPPLLSTFRKGFGPVTIVDVKVRDLRQIIMQTVAAKKEL